MECTQYFLQGSSYISFSVHIVSFTTYGISSIFCIFIISFRVYIIISFSVYIMYLRAHVIYSSVHNIFHCVDTFRCLNYIIEVQTDNEESECCHRGILLDIPITFTIKKRYNFSISSVIIYYVGTHEKRLSPQRSPHVSTSH